MFTDEHLRRIVGMMKDRYTKNGLCPNYYDIEVLIRTTVNDKITVEIMLEKINNLKNRNFDIDIDLLTSNAEKFFKQQNLAKAINQCTEILKRGNADNYFNMEDLTNASEYLIKIIIPARNVENIANELYFIGINELSLFPEPESISKEIKRYNSIK